MLRARLPTRAAVARRPLTIRQPVRNLTARAVEAPPAVEAPEVVEPPEGQEARAILRFVRGSPNKVRRVLDTIRGQTYEDALKILTYMPYRCAQPPAAA